MSTRQLRLWLCFIAAGLACLWVGFAKLVLRPVKVGLFLTPSYGDDAYWYFVLPKYLISRPHLIAASFLRFHHVQNRVLSDDARLGHDAIVLDGVRIGKDAVSTVVARYIPDGTLAVGVTIGIINMRSNLV